MACPWAESRTEIFIERNDAMLVVERNKQKAHDNPRKNRPDGELRIRPVSQAETALRCSKKCRRADFCRKDAGQDRPPWRLPVAQSKAEKRFFSAAQPQADADNQRKIGADDQTVD